MPSTSYIRRIYRTWLGWRLFYPLLAVLLAGVIVLALTAGASGTATDTPVSGSVKPAGNAIAEGPAPVFAMDDGASKLPLLDSLPMLDDWLGPAYTPPPGAAPPALPARTGRHQRILLVGECNIEGGLGPLLQKQLEQTPGVVVKRMGKRSTGLARPDYYNWPERIRQLQAEFHPDLIIAYWGDNDCQNCVTPQGKCAAGWGSAEKWHAEYARRTAEVVALMQEDAAAAVIVGMPNMRPDKFRTGIARVNAALAEGCAAGGGVFIDAWQFNTDASGNYRAQGDVGGKTATLQGEDGIHFTSFGARFMAARIHGELTTRFSFGDATAPVMAERLQPTTSLASAEEPAAIPAPAGA